MFETDYFSYDGAKKLKRMIEAYWHSHGLAPTVDIVKELNAKDARPIFVIRSNLAFDDRGFPYVPRTHQ